MTWIQGGGRETHSPAYTPPRTCHPAAPTLCSVPPAPPGRGYALARRLPGSMAAGHSPGGDQVAYPAGVPAVMGEGLCRVGFLTLVQSSVLGRVPREQLLRKDPGVHPSRLLLRGRAQRGGRCFLSHSAHLLWRQLRAQCWAPGPSHLAWQCLNSPHCCVSVS